MGTTRKPLEGSARREAIAKIVGAEYAKGTKLPDVRKILAKTLGGEANLYLGTADPVYYRLSGLDSPLTDAKGKPLASDAKPPVLRAAVKRRRDSGVRWNVLSASIEATVGRRVSETETKTLYAKAGGDLATSYAGRGTREGAPATREDAALAVEGKTAK